jgi:hypothetical protein
MIIVRYSMVRNVFYDYCQVPYSMVRNVFYDYHQVQYGQESVVEPEPVEPHHFAGARAGARPKKFQLWLRSWVCKFIKKSLNFSH